MFADALIIMRKEFKNLFKSKRTMIMTFGLPLVLFPVLFTGIGLVSSKSALEKENALYYVQLENLEDQRFIDLLEDEINFIISDQGVSEYSIIIRKSNESVNIIYDSSSQKMEYAAMRIEDALVKYNDLLADQKLIGAGLNRDDLTIIDISLIDQAPEEVQTGEILAIFIPYILILFLLIGAMSLVLDVTAGEKERGTFSILLVNQISRSSIALGKTFYVIICSILNSFSSVLGMGLGFLISMRNYGGESIADLSVFTPLRILQLLLILISISSVVSATMIYLGSLARNLKEGGSYVMPVYMLGLFAVVITMNMEAATGVFYYAIPLVNGVFVMKSLLLGIFPVMNYLFCLLSNLIFTSVIVYLTSRLYNSERVLKTV